MESFTYQLVFFLIIYIKYGHTYPTGAPAGVCSTMTPSHGDSISTQQCSTKYGIQADKTQYYTNETVRIIINGTTSSDTFRGILLLAKTQTGNQIIGTWRIVSSTIQTLACDNVANSGITHNSRSDKTSIEAIWTPPATITETTTLIRATIVTTKEVFFVNCFSVTLTARQANQSTNATTVAANTTTAATTTAAPSTTSVGVNISWTYATGVTAVKMQVTNLNPSQYCALGLSLDQEMGEDHVFVCKYLPTNTVVMERRINPSGSSPPVLASTITNPGGVFNITTQKVENGVIFCEFTLSGFGNAKRRRRAISSLSQTTSYYPLIAIGNLDSSADLTYHTSRIPLSPTVQLNQAAIITYNADGSDAPKIGLMKAHGIIMIFTWILFVSTGVLIARYFKPVWPGRKICGKAVWFSIHRALMTSVAILTIIAFILILVFEKGKWISRDETREFAHSIVGILVICFAIIQPIMALFRCAPDGEYRYIFNYVHAAVGSAALVLSVVAIFIAMFFTSFNFTVNKEWVIILVWACWLPVIFFAFQFIELYFKRQESVGKKTDSYDLSYGNGIARDNPTEVEPNPTKDRIKIIVLLVHILVAFVLSLALAIVIGKT
ncbi:hypothetical protein I4U23_024052 [Adineta vaga]|nr:hypothetical protein I4U23_024052 [Adineta vaga]